jgi:hypothetical protein
MSNRKVRAVTLSPGIPMMLMATSATPTSMAIVPTPLLFHDHSGLCFETLIGRCVNATEGSGSLPSMKFGPGKPRIQA